MHPWATGWSEHERERPLDGVLDAFALAERLGLAPTVEVGDDGRPAQVRSPLAFSEARG